jgi:hypothetical protein
VEGRRGETNRGPRPDEGSAGVAVGDREPLIPATGYGRRAADRRLLRRPTAAQRGKRGNHHQGPDPSGNGAQDARSWARCGWPTMSGCDARASAEDAAGSAERSRGRVRRRRGCVHVAPPKRAPLKTRWPVVGADAARRPTGPLLGTVRHATGALDRL